MLYPQNGDRIVALDSLTSLHPMRRLRRCPKLTPVSLISMLSTAFLPLTFILSNISIPSPLTLSFQA